MNVEAQVGCCRSGKDAAGLAAQPENVLGQMNMKREAQVNVDKGVTTALFSDPAEAVAWLERQ